MYDQSSFLIAGVLFVSMAAAIEIGYQIGLRTHEPNESSKAHVTTIQASLLGVLALLLGFTFSLSLQRYDSRSEAVVDEANAIGTTWLRAQLLPATVRPEAVKTLRTYIDLRVRSSDVSLVDDGERARLVVQSNAELDRLWGYARQAALEEPNPVTTGLFIQALNEMIDSFGRRDAALSRHVPELVLFLLYGTFLMSGTIVGFASGIAGHRTSLVAYIMIALIVVLVFIIIDLDRPRRGLIEVSQKSLLDLQTAIHAPASPATQ